MFGNSRFQNILLLFHTCSDAFECRIWNNRVSSQESFIFIDVIYFRTHMYTQGNGDMRNHVYHLSHMLAVINVFVKINGSLCTTKVEKLNSHL
jgi:hypothetical protein